MNSVYTKALDAICNKINKALLHPLDFEKVVDMFNRLLKAGSQVGNSDEIHGYLEKAGVDREIANEIQTIYEVLETSKKQLNYWDPAFIQSIIEEQ